MVLSQTEEREQLPRWPLIRRDRLFQDVSAKRLGIFWERQAGGIGAFEESANRLALGINLRLIGPILDAAPAAGRPYPCTEPKGGGNEREA
jgi:hypothetical protein